jgi:hypothetical protein
MADIPLSRLNPEDPENCLSDAARRRIRDAYLEAEQIRWRALVSVEARYRSETNVNVSFSEYCAKGRAAREINKANLASARLILRAKLQEYKAAGKSGNELRWIMDQELEGLAWSAVLTTAESRLLHMELGLNRLGPDAVGSTAKRRTDQPVASVGTTTPPPKGYKTALGRNIDKWRKECGWSLDELAKRTGFDKKLILGHVNDGKRARPSTVKAYAEAFSKKLSRPVTVAELEA